MNFLSIPEAAQLLQKTRQYVWVLIKTGKLLGKKVGRNFIIADRDLKRYQKSLTIKKKRKEVK